MNNKIKVNIAGSVYTIIGEKSKDEVEAIANFVDEEIKKITSQNYLLNSTMAATLVALNVSSDNFDLRKEINLLSEDSEFPIKKQEEFLKNNQKIEKEKEELKHIIKDLTDRNNVLVHTISTLEKRYE
ncbi:cell division protein ZapA, partial [Parvimonas micra]